jgi:ATP-binding cassette subfamily B protein
MYEILSNLSDIKLNNLEEAKNKDWQFIQRRLFKNYLNKLKLSQVEQSGSKILSTIQLFSVTVISALFVVKGEISVGVMFSIIFIVNQLNVPISNLINFILNAQLISNSLQRISEIHNLEDENADGEEPDNITTSNILLNQLTFCYNDSLPVLKNITVCIPANRTTAIVGYSGSGKTTLLKLLLKFYDDYKGEILLEHKGEKNLKRIRSSYWREQCGAVLQESNIYSDTIAYNITLTGIDSLDYDRLAFAIEMAHLTDLVNTLPLGISTKLNSAGINLSSGQRQRILIARMIYKSPSFVFLDEATNSLDANTEKVIMNNLTDFFQNRTVVIIAHRLSTVKNADQIIVLDKGEIVEIGNHRALVDSRGAYFHLIKNQLELEYGEQ